MIVRGGVEWLHRAPFELTLEARGTGVGGASLTLTHESGLAHGTGRSGGA
jgi:hypothetical protein